MRRWNTLRRAVMGAITKTDNGVDPRDLYIDYDPFEEWVFRPVNPANGMVIGSAWIVMEYEF